MKYVDHTLKGAEFDLLVDGNGEVYYEDDEGQIYSKNDLDKIILAIVTAESKLKGNK